MTTSAKSESRAAWVLPFEALGRGDLPRVGGKGANLGEMTAAGLPVPPGFCLDTGAYRAFLQEADDALFVALDALAPKDLAGVRALGGQLRAHLESLPLPAGLQDALGDAYRALGDAAPVAVRSSATAEDLPEASFAGQQDTYLNVIGAEALEDAVRRCWASLYTDRAILYRLENGFPHREVALSVVVQRMVRPEVSGLLFTADPVTGHRGRLVIEASFGLGEALVSGLVTPDRFVVDKRNLTLLEREIHPKGQAIEALPGGGTRIRSLSEAEGLKPSLSEADVFALARMALKVEAHYGTPQDLEWAIEGGRPYLLQARPITNLFPIPPAPPEEPGPRMYICFNHLQVMLDPMPPLARDVWRALEPFTKPASPLTPFWAMIPAGGRLWLDVTAMVMHPLFGAGFSKALAVADVGISARLLDLRSRPEYQAVAEARGAAGIGRLARIFGPIFAGAAREILFPSPGSAVGLRAQMDAVVAQVDARVQALPPGAPRLRALVGALRTELTPWIVRILPPRVFPAIAAIRALPRLLPEDPAVPGLISDLERGLEGNVTTEMDLRVGDLADGVRGKGALAEGIRAVVAGELPREALGDLPGGAAFVAALDAFLQAYGMRGPSEIDVSRIRWSEDPRGLLQVILGNLDHAPGAHRARHDALKAKAEAAAADLIGLAKQRGGPKGALAARLVPYIRRGLALREHPKYLLIRALALMRREALEEGARLVARGDLTQAEDVFFLGLNELVDALEAEETGDLKARVAARRAQHARDFKRAPPPMMTSEGEVPRLPPPKDLPPGALAGTAASGGVIEGIAKVLRDPHTEVLAAGEILVAPFTDPGWTPLFLNAKALVMEVGGMMTHGSVIAREYGIPAVVGVSGAMKAIETGDRLRVDGDRGLVFVLKDEPEVAEETR